MIELLEAHVDRLRLELDSVNQKRSNLNELSEDILVEILETRRMIHRYTLDQRRENGS